MHIKYTPATAQDASAIAELHARSWQLHYRGSLKDEYLDGPVLADRLDVWTQRMQQPAANQWVLLAKDGDRLCGFACVYMQHDPQWGALLDNLHVASTHQGRGIGKALLQAAAQWIGEQVPPTNWYLWVLANNRSAIQFYERMGGRRVEQTTVENPGGGFSDIFRYVWEHDKSGVPV